MTRQNTGGGLDLPNLGFVFLFGASGYAGRALVNRAARRLGHPTSIPRAIMSRSPEALALGPAVISFRRRYHCPSFGCLLNRSRDCTRSRVPPLRVGAMLTLLRVPLSAACASLRRYLAFPARLAVGCAEARFAGLHPSGFHPKTAGRSQIPLPKVHAASWSQE
jgi:hypothetical protein